MRSPSQIVCKTPLKPLQNLQILPRISEHIGKGVCRELSTANVGIKDNCVSSIDGAEDKRLYSHCTRIPSLNITRLTKGDWLHLPENHRQLDNVDSIGVAYIPSCVDC
jgi:hypothetical protein